MTLRRAGLCVACGAAAPAGTTAWWNPSARTVTCTACATELAASSEPATPAPATDQQPTGVAGASARREGTKRREQRAATVRALHPKIGGFLLAVTDEPQHIKAWDQGADGEEHVGRILDRLAADNQIRVLHDRLKPGSRTANIDHIAVTPTGTVIVDAKNYKGRVEQRPSGSLFRPGPMKLFVNGRDRSVHVEKLIEQIDAVTRVVGGDTGGIPVTGILCFTQADFSLLARPFDFGPVTVHWPRSMRKALVAAGPVDVTELDEIRGHLAAVLRVA